MDEWTYLQTPPIDVVCPLIALQDTEGESAIQSMIRCIHILLTGVRKKERFFNADNQDIFNMFNKVRSVLNWPELVMGSLDSALAKEKIQSVIPIYTEF
jgi:hypothetical protein